MYEFRGFECCAACFFSLLGIWAAVSRRHWFVRFGGAVAPLLLAMLIPAYEVVVAFGLQMGLIAAAIRLRRRGFRCSPRFSLRTLLLLGAATALAAALTANLPSWTALQWIRLALIGLVGAYAGLLALWIVVGAAHPRWRVVGGLAGLTLLTLMLHALDAFNYAAGAVGEWSAWSPWLAGYYEPAYVATWLAYVWPGVVFVFGILLAAVALGRASGWFTSPAERPSSRCRRWGRRSAQALLSLTLLYPIAPLAYLLVQLTTPTPLPATTPPAPNGYDRFVAAGKLVPWDDLYSRWRAALTMGEPELRRVIAQLEPVVRLVDEGLALSCRGPHSVAIVDEHVAGRLRHVFNADLALFVQSDYLRRFRTPANCCRSLLRQLRFEHERSRGGGLDFSSSWEEQLKLAQLHGVLVDLPAAECRQLARDLWSHHEGREPYAERRAWQLILDQHGDWQTHARLLLALDAGEDPYADDLDAELLAVAMLRLLTVDAALQVYWLEQGRLPARLEELAPEYLPSVPLDPYVDEPLRYVGRGAGYCLYVVGPDREDDDGCHDYVYADDIVCLGPHTRPYWRRAVQPWLDRFRACFSRPRP